jgi:hypothetical protein
MITHTLANIGEFFTFPWTRHVCTLFVVELLDTGIPGSVTGVRVRIPGPGNPWPGRETRTLPGCGGAGGGARVVAFGGELITAGRFTGRSVRIPRAGVTGPTFGPIGTP